MDGRKRSLEDNDILNDINKREKKRKVYLCCHCRAKIEGFSYSVVANPPQNENPSEPPQEEEGACGGACAGACGGAAEDAPAAAAAADTDAAPDPETNDTEELVICGAEAAGGVENGGEAVLVRRMNPRGGQLIRSKAQESNSLDQAENRLPPVDTMEACNKAAERSLMSFYFYTIRELLFYT
ncbi:hypothetical protein TNCT_518711 [Trichonephila clavata]|uniref:Uncharacterized protein n=1 Tax=Trichonephila clavata TaxID=2740835 RepID=A0A8X6LJC5_TRICU|nr:hypothetical protein TNCT_518711 [Trichonephila clavata]